MNEQDGDDDQKEQDDYYERDELDKCDDRYESDGEKNENEDDDEDDDGNGDDMDNYKYTTDKNVLFILKSYMFVLIKKQKSSMKTSVSHQSQIIE